MKRSILIIEDEKPIADAVAYNLKRDGYEVTVARDGESGLSLARTQKPDLIILDLMLPGMDGLAVCRAIRREARTPILMLTAKAEEIDKVVGFELGADDYVTKPFSMRELLARLKAILSRASVAPPPDEEERLVSGDLVMDLAQHTVELDTRPVTLSPKEFELLAFFMRNRGRVLPRQTLLERVWGDTYVDPHTVDVHISWLRQKVEADQTPGRIVTVRGVGYKFTG